MGSKKRWILLLAVMMVLNLALVGCRGNTDEQKIGDDPKDGVTDIYDGPKILDYYSAAEPQTLDTQQMYGSPDMILANMFSEGLLRSGKVNGETVPGVAESYKVSDDGKAYTFKLRSDAKWMDGSPVTAEDFFFGWRLALEHTPYSFLLSEYIIGASEYENYDQATFLAEIDSTFKNLSEEQKDERVENMTDEELTQYQTKRDELWEEVKVSASGSEITVELISATPYFPFLTTMPVFAPVKETFYNERKAKGDYSLEASGLNSNGPWKIVEWRHNENFKLEKNPHYWNRDNINLDILNLRIVNDVQTRTNLLKTGQLDGSAIQAKDIPEFTDIAVLEEYGLQTMVDMPDFASFYIEFNHVEDTPMKNTNIRKAIMYAMDRESFVTKINLGDEPALGFVPTMFPGYQKSFREESGMRLFEDNQKEKAKEYLAQGLKELGLDKLPPIDMMIGESDIARKIAEKFQEDWAEIGITVNLMPLPWSEQLTRLQKGDFHLASSGWGPDYPDPMTFLELFESTNPNNSGKYSNPEVDRLIRAAKTESNAKERMEYMYQVEKLLFEDAALAPQYYRIAHWTFKKYLTGVVNKGIGATTDFYWADIDMNAKLAK